jgi:hypothetical protein
MEPMATQIPPEATPLMGVPAVIAIVAAARGFGVPSRYLYPLSLAVGMALGIATCLALQLPPERILFFALTGLMSGAAASGTVSGVNAQYGDDPLPTAQLAPVTMAMTRTGGEPARPIAVVVPTTAGEPDGESWRPKPRTATAPPPLPPLRARDLSGQKGPITA